MYKLDLPIDRKEAAAIERRRIQEEQRKSRIFNAKVRQIGIDEQALEQQKKDRAQMELMERRRDEAFGEYDVSLLLVFNYHIHKCAYILVIAPLCPRRTCSRVSQSHWHQSTQPNLNSHKYWIMIHRVWLSCYFCESWHWSRYAVLVE